MSEFLTKDAIFSKHDIIAESVDVPEWGGKVRVKALTGRERDEYEAALIDQKGKKTTVNMTNARARMAMMAVVDEQGQRLFAESDIPMLSTKSAAALDRIFDVARRLAGLTDQDVEELEGNSAGTTSADSPSV